MAPWTAWQETRSLAFLHARVRDLLVRQGVGSHMLDVDGHPTHVYVAGPEDARRTVVLLHGLGASANDWFRAIPLLAWRGDRVIAPDLPGHGLSPPHTADGYHTVREHAHLVRRIARELGAAGSEVNLVGHSLGGWVAARAHLDGMALNRLVLVESAGLEYEGMWDSIEMLRIEHEADVRRFFKTITHQTPVGLDLLSREVASMFKSPAVVNFIDADHAEDVIRDAELANVTARTTILWGESDGLIPPILAHRWQAGIPGSRLVWIPRCGHAPQFERPMLYQRLLEEALGHPTLTQELRKRLTLHLPESLRRRFAAPEA